MSENIKKVLYEHWKIIFGVILTLIIIPFLLSLSSNINYFFSGLIPRWWFLVLGLVLVVSIFFNIIFYLNNKNLLKELEKKNDLKEQILKEINRENTEKALLINNLIYKEDKKEAFCPFCFEKDRVFHRMQRVYSERYGEPCYNYRCFVCEGEIINSFDEDINKDNKDIKF